MGHPAKLTLMSVQQIHVEMEEHVLMELTLLLVSVVLDTIGQIGKLILMIVQPTLVKMEEAVWMV